jgi:hypothetical protein
MTFFSEGPLEDQLLRSRAIKYLAGLVAVIAVISAAIFIYDAATHKIYTSRHGFSFRIHKDWGLDTGKLDNYSTLEEAQRMNASSFSISAIKSLKCPLNSQPVPNCAIKINGHLISNLGQSTGAWTNQQIENNIQAGYKVSKRETVKLGKEMATRVTYQNSANDTAIVYYYVSNNQALSLSAYPASSTYRREFDRLARSFRFN